MYITSSISLSAHTDPWMKIMQLEPRCLVFQAFLESDPILSEFKAEILKYQNLELQITETSDSFRVGQKALQLNSGMSDLIFYILPIGKPMIIQNCVSASSPHIRYFSAKKVT